jgi:hypothetical protein
MRPVFLASARFQYSLICQRGKKASAVPPNLTPRSSSVKTALPTTLSPTHCKKENAMTSQYKPKSLCKNSEIAVEQITSVRKKEGVRALIPNLKRRPNAASRTAEFARLSDRAVASYISALYVFWRARLDSEPVGILAGRSSSSSTSTSIGRPTTRAYRNKTGNDGTRVPRSKPEIYS